MGAKNPYVHGVKRHNKRLGNSFDQIVRAIESGAGKPVAYHTSAPKEFYTRNRLRMVLTWNLSVETDYAFRPAVHLTFNLRRGGKDYTHTIHRTLPDTSISLKKFRKELPKLFWKYYAGKLS